MRLRAGAAGSRRACVRGLRPGNPPGNHMPSRSLETPIGISERIPSGGWETSRVRNTLIGERAHVRVSARTAKRRPPRGRSRPQTITTRVRLAIERQGARIATRSAVGYDTNTRRTLPQLSPDQRKSRRLHEIQKFGGRSRIVYRRAGAGESSAVTIAAGSGTVRPPSSSTCAEARRGCK